MEMDGELMNDLRNRNRTISFGAAAVLLQHRFDSKSGVKVFLVASAFSLPRNFREFLY
jgi:hypothetical protein